MDEILKLSIYLIAFGALCGLSGLCYMIIYWAARYKLGSDDTQPVDEAETAQPKAEPWIDKYFRGEFDPQPPAPLRKIVIRERR